ncbi:hypothetical protein GRS48_13565 [Halorubrum sp. JWXQ-INN 858]|nr:hypothetical protein [Halorubrum sp. JWXQ-INN 858]MWV65841.1 hypothetical protein [Halorubrum sp. JWXQ-INN 858]
MTGGRVPTRSDASARDDRSPERDTRPPTEAVVVSVVAGAVAVGAALIAAPLAGAVVGLGVAVIAVGTTLLASERVLLWGAGIGVVGLAAAGYTGAPPEPLLVVAVALAVAWDAADHGLSLGRHVGRGAGARRNVAVHAGSAALVGVVAVGVVYLVYALAAGGQPVTALALLLLGAIALASAFK